MIVRYILNIILMLFLTVLGYIITPLNYFIKGWVRKHNVIPLWWFLNDTKPYDKNDIDWGDYGRFENNFIGFYKQNAIRNSHWNLRLILGKKLQGEKYAINGEMKLLSPRWNYKLGTTKGTYRINSRKYFRVSAIIKLGKRYFHYQLGTNDYRYLFKFKII